MLSAEGHQGNGVFKTQGQKSEPQQSVERDKDAILGIEQRLERAESDGQDTSVARIAVSKKYSNYAAQVVSIAGGDVQAMKTLTDKNNNAPLRWADGQCENLD